MAEHPMRDSALPIALIATGALWLLFTLDWIPSFDWVVTLVLVASGMGILLLEGITRKSVVSGPLLIALGGAWYLHFRYGMHWRYLVPVLFIVAGVLLLVARLPAIPDVRRGRPGTEPPPQ